jgi:alcohol dehydrogenase
VGRHPKAGPNQVVIKIHASGLCYTDVHIDAWHDPYRFLECWATSPLAKLWKSAPASRRAKWAIAWAWAGCRSRLRALRVVLARQERAVPEQRFPPVFQLQGSHAEYMLAYADATMLIPDALSYEQAAPIFCAGYTVWSGLRSADPKPHERVAVVGIGGLGHLALQYSKGLGL